METPILTPMQQAIKKMKEQQAHSKKWAVGSEYHSGRLLAYTKSLEILTNLLPKEQEAIEQAYNTGSEHGFNDEDKTGKQYFNQTYKDNGK